MHHNRVFGVKQLNDGPWMAVKILPRRTLVAMATKFENKLGCNSSGIIYIFEIVASNSGFWGWAVERFQSNSTTTDPCYHGNEM